jgi:hypothetical protein
MVVGNIAVTVLLLVEVVAVGVVLERFGGRR